jgi:hypothetical protein
MTRHALGELSHDDPMEAARAVKRLLSRLPKVELWHDIYGVLWSRKPPRGELIGTYDDAARAYHIAQDIDCAKDEWEGRRP